MSKNKHKLRNNNCNRDNQGKFTTGAFWHNMTISRSRAKK
jgi:hypothetical protein